MKMTIQQWWNDSQRREVLNLSQCHCVQYKSHRWTGLRSNPGLRGERPASNSLNHGTDCHRPKRIHYTYRNILLVPDIEDSRSPSHRSQLMMYWGIVTYCCRQCREHVSAVCVRYVQFYVSTWRYVAYSTVHVDEYLSYAASTDQ
jgi:hypothetical protein